MKIELVYANTKCPYLGSKFLEIQEILLDYPDKEELKMYDIMDLDYETVYELSSKYGFLTVPMIIVDGKVIYRKIPSISSLLFTLENLKSNKCHEIEREQILLY